MNRLFKVVRYRILLFFICQVIKISSVKINSFSESTSLFVILVGHKVSLTVLQQLDFFFLLQNSSIN